MSLFPLPRRPGRAPAAWRIAIRQAAGAAGGRRDQRALLASSDPKLARNKKLVFDFWRIVYEGGHMERAAEFMAPEYIQHNPNVESGRDAFVNTIGKARPTARGGGGVALPIIDIIAERDIVMVMWARKVRDREHAGADLRDDLVRCVPRRCEVREDRRALGFLRTLGICGSPTGRGVLSLMRRDDQNGAPSTMRQPENSPANR